MLLLRTKRLSICACDFVALKDEINVGKEYSVLEDDGRPLVVSGFTWHCGGCDREFRISCVMAQETNGEFAPMPADLFQEEIVN